MFVDAGIGLLAFAVGLWETVGVSLVSGGRFPLTISSEALEFTQSPVLSSTLTIGTSGSLILSANSASCNTSSIAFSFAFAIATFLSAVKIAISFA